MYHQEKTSLNCKGYRGLTALINPLSTYTSGNQSHYLESSKSIVKNKDFSRVCVEDKIKVNFHQNTKECFTRSNWTNGLGG